MRWRDGWHFGLCNALESASNRARRSSTGRGRRPTVGVGPAVRATEKSRPRVLPGEVLVGVAAAVDREGAGAVALLFGGGGGRWGEDGEWRMVSGWLLTSQDAI